MRHTRLMLSAILPMVLVVGCGYGSSGSGVRADGEIELTREQPVMAVEFEASFESLGYAAGIFAQLYQVRPNSSDDLSDVGSLTREVWEGGGWVPYGTAPEITGVGANTFRYRWVFELSASASEAVVPFEVEINPSWPGGGDEPPPGAEQVTDLRIAVISSYPLER